jgi:hypothetical protein
VLQFGGLQRKVEYVPRHLVCDSTALYWVELQVISGRCHGLEVPRSIDETFHDRCLASKQTDLSISQQLLELCGAR